jgi:hypothetical protein
VSPSTELNVLISRVAKGLMHLRSFNDLVRIGASLHSSVDPFFSPYTKQFSTIQYATAPTTTTQATSIGLTTTADNLD